MPENENEESKELKYEGLTALIIEGQRHDKERHDDFSKFCAVQFDDLKAYNKKQNGHQAEAMRQIRDLKKESDKREFTCGATVEILQKRTKYTGIVKWVEDHQKLALFLSLSILLGLTIVVGYLYKHELLGKLWRLIF